MGMHKAIVSLPKKAIEDVCKIHISKLPFLAKRKHFNEKETALFGHMFEIYLREDYEDVFMFREEENKLVSDIKSRSVSRCATPRSENKKDTSFWNNLAKRSSSQQQN